MRLQRLTALEQDKIHAELADIKREIARLRAIIENEESLKKEIIKELNELKNTYADKRRTRIEAAVDVLSEADLIPDEDVVVTLTRKGYIKRVPVTLYNVQHRGGKGKMGMADLDDSDDIVEDIFAAKNHDMLLFFTNLGRIYSMQVFEVPEASRMAKGRAIVNLLPLTEGEHVVKLLCARDLEENYIVMVTQKGTIKRTEGAEFTKIRSTGIRAITLNEGDQLSFCAVSSGDDSIVLATAHGQGIRFKEGEVRAMGRQAAGVIGIRLVDNDVVVGMEVVSDNNDILFATALGYGKRVRVGDFRVAHRGGQGVRTIPTDERNGLVIGLVVVSDISDVLLIDNAGKIIRLSSKEVRTMGRQAKGVRLIRLDKGQKLAGLAVIDVVMEQTGQAGVPSESQEPDQNAPETSSIEETPEE
jgi:DNA gyrase subunit A